MHVTHLRTILFVVGVLCGITVGYTSSFATEVALFGFTLAAGEGILVLTCRNRARGVSLALLIFLFSFGVSIGVVRVQSVEEKTNYVCETSCTFEARVTTSPRIKDAYQVFTVTPKTEEDTALDIQIRVPLYPEYRVGDTLLLSGKVSLPRTTFPHGEEATFDYAAYLQTKHVGSEMLFPKVEVVGSGPDSVNDSLARLKDGLVSRIDMYVLSPASTIASGMLFGNSSMSKELVETFRTAGLSHIVVLSGFNIVIVISAILFVFAFLPLLLRTILAGVCVLIFVTMVGGEASVVRATAMAFVGLLATVLGRPYVAKQALLISLLLIVMYEPYALLHDVSLHLSFLATVGIVYGSEVYKKVFLLLVEKITSRVPPLYISEIIVTTLAAYFATLPYVMYTFGTVSVYALLANMLVIPLVPLAMLFSFLVVVTSFFSEWLSLAVGFIDSVWIGGMLFVAEGIARLPFASLSFTVSFTHMCMMYGALGVSLWAFSQYAQKRDETRVTYQDGALIDTIPY
jgi:competence protein ComEC